MSFSRVITLKILLLITLFASGHVYAQCVTSPQPDSHVALGELLLKDAYECITDEYGPAGHAGIDYRALTPLPVYSPVSGRVVVADSQRGHVAVEIDGSELTFIFLHLSQIDVIDGPINKGDLVGLSGDITFDVNFPVTGPHLHVEVRNASQPGNPSLPASYSRNVDPASVVEFVDFTTYGVISNSPSNYSEFSVNFGLKNESGSDATIEEIAVSFYPVGTTDFSSTEVGKCYRGTPDGPFEILNGDTKLTTNLACNRTSEQPSPGMYELAYKIRVNNSFITVANRPVAVLEEQGDSQGSVSEEKVTETLAEYRQAGELAEFALQQAIIDDPTSPLITNSQLIEILLSDIGRFVNPIESAGVAGVDLQEIIQIEELIRDEIAQSDNQENTIYAILEEVNRVTGGVGVYDVAKNSYNFVVNFRGAIDKSNPLEVRYNNAIDTVDSVRSAYLASITVANKVLDRFPESKVSQAALFWTKNRVAKQLIRLDNAATKLTGPINAILLGAEAQAFIYKYIKGQTALSIKQNIFESNIAAMRSRQARLSNLVETFLMKEQVGEDVEILDILDNFRHHPQLQNTGVPTTSLSEVFSNRAQHLGFSNMTNMERILVAIDALAAVSELEDLRLNTYIDEVLDPPLFADHVFATVLRRDENDFNIVDVATFKAKIFPYRYNNSPINGERYYGRIYEILFNAEVAAFTQDKLATIGEDLVKFEADPDVPQCELSNTCTTLPTVSQVEASDGDFSDRIRVQWSPVPTATSYDVLRCESETSDNCEQISATNNTVYNEYSLIAGRDYFYRIRACNIDICSGQLSDSDTGFLSASESEDSMLHISDSIIDGTRFDGGALFTQRTTVRNTGTTTWNSNYCLVDHSGPPFGLSSKVCAISSVAPGATYTFEIPMQAPQADTVDRPLRNNWYLERAGIPVSGLIWTEIIVTGVIPSATQPGVFSATANGASVIDLSWPYSASGSFYRLSRSTSVNGNFHFLSEISALTFSDNNLLPNTQYYYRLQRCADSREETCSEFAIADAVTGTPEAPSSLISSFTVSGTSFAVGQVMSMSADMQNPGGIALNNVFNFVFALSDNGSLDNTDDILFTAADNSFVLATGSGESFSKSYRIPDDASVGDRNALACVRYRDFAQEIQEVCQSFDITILEEPLVVPSAPNAPALSYQQGQGQVGVAWNNSSSGGFYRVERSANSTGGFSEIYSGSGFSYIDNNISNGATFYYRLKSCQNSLIVSCSNASSTAQVSTLATAINDFRAQNLNLSRSGNEITIEAGQAYTGTSINLVRPNIGFFLSSDAICTNQDIFLRAESSGLSNSDVVDVEEITVTYPPQASTGTWYACAIADYDNRFAESNENNNAASIVAQNDVSAPTLEALKVDSGGQIRASWNAVPGNVSYRLKRSISAGGPFGNVYIGTATSYFDHNVNTCSQYYYRLDSCNSVSADAFCSESPVVTTSSLPNVSPAPTVTVLGEKKVEINWSDEACASYYVLGRKTVGASPSSDRGVYNGTEKSYIDLSVVANTTYSYEILYCRSEQGLFDNGCASFSPAVVVTTPSEHLPDTNWVEQSPDPAIAGRTRTLPTVFNNKLWLIGGYQDGVQQNDVWSSVDGVSWDQVLNTAPFAPREFVSLAVHNGRLFLIGGKLSNGMRSNQIWSTDNGIDWVLEQQSAPFASRSNPEVISFQGKLWVIGGSERSEATNTFNGDLADIWNSTDGKNWTQVTASAPFGVQGEHEVLVIDGRLLVYTGRSVERSNGGLQTQIFNDSIWSSVDGVNWILEEERLPYGPRDEHSVLEFSGQYWMIGGRERVQSNASRDDANQMLDSIREYLQNDDVWISSDGLTWSVVDKATSIPATQAREAINFNNRIWVGQDVGGVRWVANYGLIPDQPQGQLSIIGLPVVGSEVGVDLSNINGVDSFDLQSLTYLWKKNGTEIYGETEPRITLNGFVIGDDLQVQVRYTNENSELLVFDSPSVTVTINTIFSYFELGNVVSSVGFSGVANSLTDWDDSYSVIYTSSNESIVLVSGTDQNVSIDVVGVGNATVTAQITDVLTQATKQLSFDVVANQGVQLLSFAASQVSKPDSESSFSMSLSQTGLSSAPISYLSSDTSVATVTANGSSVDIQIQGVGSSTITAIRPGDATYTMASTSFLLDVFVADFDADGISDSDDNCVSVDNPDQSNFDGDLRGDLCDPDDDGDFVVDTSDCASLNTDRWLNLNGFNDTDGDAVGEGESMLVCSGLSLPPPFVSIGGDNCPSVPNPDQANSDSDLEGNACDSDDDNDGMTDVFENANGLNSLDPNDAGLDPDDDGLTNLEEFKLSPNLNPNNPDTDGDGIDDSLDNEPVFSDNNCTGGQTLNALFTEAILREIVTTDITCGATISITIEPTEVQNTGSLRLIAPKVIFKPGFKSGELHVISKNSCAVCP